MTGCSQISATFRTYPNRPISFAAFDLDGTLIDGEDAPFGGIELALAAISNKGIRSLIVTGRSALSMRLLAPTIPGLLRYVEDGVLVSDGNVLLDLATGAASLRNGCPAKLLEELMELGAEMVVEWTDGLSATTPAAAVKFARTYRVPRSAIMLKDPFPRGDFASAVVYKPGTQLIRSIAQRSEAVVTPLEPFGSCVVRPPDSDKMKALSDHLALQFNETSLSRTVAFGDGATDASMLAFSAIGVATSGSDAFAEAAADQRLSQPTAEFILMQLSMDGGNS